MKQVSVTVPANLSGEGLWAVLADFSGFLDWAGGGDGEIRIEGEGIGMVRHLKMAVGDLAERLIQLDHEQRVLGYQLVYGEPLGMTQYKAVVQVVDADEGCELIWQGEFESETEAETAETLKATYMGMTGALVAYVEGLQARTE